MDQVARLARILREASLPGLLWNTLRGTASSVQRHLSSTSKPAVSDNDLLIVFYLCDYVYACVDSTNLRSSGGANSSYSGSGGAYGASSAAAMRT